MPLKGTRKIRPRCPICDKLCKEYFSGGYFRYFQKTCCDKDCVRLSKKRHRPMIPKTVGIKVKLPRAPILASYYKKSDKCWRCHGPKEPGKSTICESCGDPERVRKRKMAEANYFNRSLNGTDGGKGLYYANQKRKTLSAFEQMNRDALKLLKRPA